MKFSRNGTTSLTNEELCDAMKVYQKAWVPDPSRGRAPRDEDFIMRAPGPLVPKSEVDALAAELARCRSANVYDGAAHKRVAELEAEVEALKHDLEKSMANHVADINGFESETEVQPGPEYVEIGLMISLDDGLDTVIVDWNDKRFALSAGTKIYARSTSDRASETEEKHGA